MLLARHVHSLRQQGMGTPADQGRDFPAMKGILLILFLVVYPPSGLTTGLLKAI